MNIPTMYLLRGCVWRGEPSAACAIEPTPAAEGPALLPCREDVGRGSSVARAFNRPGMPAEDASCDVPACIGSHATRAGSVIDYMPRGADTTWAVPYAACLQLQQAVYQPICESVVPSGDRSPDHSARSLIQITPDSSPPTSMTRRVLS